MDFMVVGASKLEEVAGLAPPGRPPIYTGAATTDGSPGSSGHTNVSGLGSLQPPEGLPGVNTVCLLRSSIMAAKSEVEWGYTL